MTAKEYLQNCRKLKIQMENKKRVYDSIRNSIIYLQGIAYDRDKVQTSPSDALSSTMSKLVDAEREAMDAIWEYERYFNDCMDKINSLSRREYTEILTRRYFSEKYYDSRLVQIACDLDYSYERTKHLHGEALQEFYRKFLSGKS